jgi:hypothetical protein
MQRVFQLHVGGAAAVMPTARRRPVSDATRRIRAFAHSTCHDRLALLLIGRPDAGRAEGGRNMATSGYESDDYVKGEGWLTFSFVVLLIVGFFNVVLGITLIAGYPIYVSGATDRVVVIGNTDGWGWVLLIAGGLEVIAGFGVLVRSQVARWFGIFMATLAALGQLPVIFGRQPLYSFLVVLLSVLVIYGLAQYGGRDRVPV